VNGFTPQSEVDPGYGGLGGDREVKTSEIQVGEPYLPPDRPVEG
jgi:hypothetical protein